MHVAMDTCVSPGNKMRFATLPLTIRSISQIRSADPAPADLTHFLMTVSQTPSSTLLCALSGQPHHPLDKFISAATIPCLFERLYMQPLPTSTVNNIRSKINTGATRNHTGNIFAINDRKGSRLEREHGHRRRTSIS